MVRKLFATALCVIAAAVSQAGTMSYVSGQATHSAGTWPRVQINRGCLWQSSTYSDYPNRIVQYEAEGGFQVDRPGYTITYPGTSFFLDRDDITIKFKIRWTGNNALDTPPANTTGVVETSYLINEFCQTPSGMNGYVNGSAKTVLRDDISVPYDSSWYGLNILQVDPTMPISATYYLGSSTPLVYRDINVTFGSWSVVGTNQWEAEATVSLYDTGTPEEFDVELLATQIDPWTAASMQVEWFHKLKLVNGSSI
ncbi:MAG: hypothetical protein KF824_13275 [Fimbriimonadaceae bacterium]|nr:MAG: hypothetical protein KF824_13275 [Fimbriimonadaceae bacterium]